MKHWWSSRKLTLIGMSLLLLAMAAATLFILLSAKETRDALHISLLAGIFLLICLLLRIFYMEGKKKATALANSERRYQTLTEVSPVGIFHTDATGYTTYVNPRWCQITGFSSEKALGYGWLDLVHEDDRKILRSGWKEATGSRNVSLSEYRFIRPDGAVIWVLGQAFPERNAHNEIIGYVGTTTDITERKIAEEKIIVNEMRLKKAQEIGKLGYWRRDIHSDTMWASKEAMNIYGFAAKDGEVKREKVIACVVNKEAVEEATAALIKENKEFNIEMCVMPADGSAMRYVSAIAEAERNENGEPLRILGTLMDITDRIKAKNEILKEKNLSDSIINSLPGIFYLYNEQGKFLRWNKNFETVSKYTAAEISAMHPLDFFDDDTKQLLAQKISSTFTQGEDNVVADFYLKTKEKTPYYFTGTAIEYEGAKCLMGVGMDFSERVKAQEKIKETTEQLRRLTAHLQHIREEERKRIGREIHDELGQQLTAIKMDIAWIDKKTAADTPIKNKLKNVISLLDISNLSIRRILSELRPAILDNRGLEDAINWFGKQFTQSSGIPIKLHCSIDDIELPDTIATCIFRVFQEALTNIAKYAAATEVSVFLSKTENKISLSIEDDGIGFETAEVKNNKSFGILGMKERVLSLGGKFDLASSPGKGTTIKISLPY